MNVLAIVPDWNSRRDDGGSYAIHAALCHAASFSDIRVLAVLDDPSPNAYRDGPFLVLPCQRQRFGLAEKLVSSLPVLGLWARGTDAPAMVAEILRNDRIHAVVLSNTYTGVNLPDDLESRLVVLCQNVESARLEAIHTGQGGALRRTWTSLQVRRMKRLERRVLSRANAVLAVSERDAVRLARFTSEGTPVLKTPIVPDERLLALPTSDRPDDVILFVGSLSYQPNVAAAMTLADAVLPEVRRMRPGSQLVLAGSSPSAAVRSLHNDARGIAVVADFDDYVSLFARATVFAAPIRHQEGVSVKLIHAFASGTPVVATPSMLGTVGARAGTDARCADTPAEFAAAIVELLGDADARVALAVSARALIAREFSRPAAIAALRTALGL